MIINSATHWLLSLVLVSQVERSKDVLEVVQEQVNVKSLLNIRYCRSLVDVSAEVNLSEDGDGEEIDSHITS